MFGISLARISLLTRTSLGGGVGVSPTLDLNFRGQGYSAAMAGYTFNQLIDFTRTSAATYVDATGKIVSTPASRNLLTFTQEFDNAAWTKVAATVTANAATAPDGTMTADKAIATAVVGSHGVLQSATFPSGFSVFSVYAKAAEYSLFRMFDFNNGDFAASFDLTNGTVSNTGGAKFSSASAVSVGNGWYRCVVVLDSVNALRSPAFTGYPSGATLDLFGASYTGDGTSGIYLWGAQLEAGSTATDYTRNNGGVYPPRFDYDPVTLAPKGLLIEEQRTNFLTYSEQFDSAAWTKSAATVTANATTSPDGTVDADKLAETATTSTHYALHFISPVSGTTYAGSIFVKASERSWCVVELGGAMLNTYAFINLSTGAVGTTSGSPTTVSTQSYGNGWWRIVITKTASSSGTGHFAVYPAQADGTVSYAGTADSGIYIWGAQLEVGSFATSYIPTVASQVTRTADVPVNGGANFSQWYNPSEGTFLVEYQLASNSGTTRGAWRVSDGTSNNALDFRPNGGNYTVTTGGAAQADIYPGGGTIGAVNKSALAFKANDFASCTNGGTVVTDTSGTVPTVNQLLIGGLTSAAGQVLSGHIRSLRFYPTRLSNAQLQALTA